MSVAYIYMVLNALMKRLQFDCRLEAVKIALNIAPHAGQKYKPERFVREACGTKVSAWSAIYPVEIFPECEEDIDDE